MEITTSLVLPSDPATVFGLITDRGFLEEVAREAGATGCVVTVDGSTTVSKRFLQAPAEAERFIGPVIKLVEKRTWSAAGPDGSRSAELDLVADGQPMSMTGKIRLRPTAAGTAIDVSGELTVKIPLIGKKLEKLAQPAVLQGVAAEERVGRRRLNA